MYKVLYTCWYGGQRKVAVMDFINEQIIEFTMDEMERDELPAELKDYIKSIREQINNGFWDYNL